RSTFPRRPISGHHPHARDHGILVNVQAGDAIVDYVHLRLLSIPAGRGIAFEILLLLWPGFAFRDEMDSTGSRMIRGAGDCFGSLYGFGRPAAGKRRAARLL